MIELHMTVERGPNLGPTTESAFIHFIRRVVVRRQLIPKTKKQKYLA